MLLVLNFEVTHIRTSNERSVYVRIAAPYRIILRARSKTFKYISKQHLSIAVILSGTNGGIKKKFKVRQNQ